jgi:hypothetical protein
VFQASDPQTFAIDATHLLLGVGTLVCLALVGGTLLRELVERWGGQLLSRTEGDAHAINVRGLGWTMADGGDPVEDKKATGPDYYGF